MIELAVLDYLTSSLDVPVYMEKPHKSVSMPYVLIEKTGSSENNFVKRATIVVQSYGGSMFDAASLNERVKSALKDMVSQNEVSKVTLNSDYNYTDTTTKEYRYQAVFDVVHY